MNIPYIRGRVTKQAHVSIPEGTVEEEYARKGFFGQYAHLYRSEAPTAWSRIEGPLKPRAYAPEFLESPDYLASRHALLANSDVRVSLFSIVQPMPYFFRNADADELFFVHAGGGRIETDFGPLTYSEGDYLLIPRGTTYRWNPSDATRLLFAESMGPLSFPERGMLGEHALFDPAVVRVPSPEDWHEHDLRGLPKGEFELRIQREGEITQVFYPKNPLNVVGWKGTLTVMQLNVKDIRPVNSDRYHLPPSAHTTFVAPGFIVCSFLPRPLEVGDPEAMKVPFYHSNIDFDEVLFYHSGQFFSREGITPGMLTFHPQGIHHGPQAGAINRATTAQYTHEVAVMIDTKQPLKATAAAEACERKDYWKSWSEKKI